MIANTILCKCLPKDNMTDFIEIYPDVLSKEFCAKVIEDFDKNPHSKQEEQAVVLIPVKKLVKT